MFARVKAHAQTYKRSMRIQIHHAHAHSAWRRTDGRTYAQVPFVCPYMKKILYMIAIYVQVEKPANEATMTSTLLLALNQNFHTVFHIRIFRDRHF